MKLYHRTDFWGTKIEGRSRVGRFARETYGPYDVVEAQAVTADFLHGDFYGCCQHRGKRVIEIEEEHFLAAHSGDWVLYHVATCLGRSVGGGSGEYFHDFILIPEPKLIFKGPGWSRIGVVIPNMARMALANLLRPFLSKNLTNVGVQAMHHAHLGLVMPSLQAPHQSKLHSWNSKPEHRRQLGSQWQVAPNDSAVRPLW